MQTTAYLAEKIFTGDEWLTDHAVVVKDNQILEIIPGSEALYNYSIERFPGCLLLPSFIDAQIYGASGKLFAVYPDAETLQLMYDYCRAGGTGLFLPTVATNTVEVFYACMDAVRQYWNNGGKGVYGLHLEGPWLNTEKRGAHVKEVIHSPSVEEVQALLEYGKGVIKMVTLAPEVCSPEVIKLLHSQNIIVSAGHSNATFLEAIDAFDNGVATATHLYNAMSPLQHRQPGLVGAIFHHHKVMSSIIPDGYHVDYTAINIAKKIMGSRLFVITDAVTETKEGFYQHQREGDKYVCNGTLSGSALTMHRAFVNLVKYAGIEAGEAIRMCSLYPARVLNYANVYGKIAPGYVAQFNVLNKELELLKLIG